MPNVNELIAKKDTFMNGYNKGWNACIDAVRRELGLTSQEYDQETALILQRLIGRVQELRKS